MRYRERVTIQRATEIRSPKGAVTLEYAPVDGLIDLPATIVPAIAETRNPRQTTIVDRYDVVIAGRHRDVRVQDAVLDNGGRTFEIEQVDALLGERQTRVQARLVVAPTAAEPGS